MSCSLAEEATAGVGQRVVVGAAHTIDRRSSTDRVIVGAWRVCLSSAQEDVRPKKQQEPQAQETKLRHTHMHTADQHEPQAKKRHKKEHPPRMLVMCSYHLLRHVVGCESRTEGGCGGKTERAAMSRVATIWFCERKQSWACTSGKQLRTML